MYMGKEKQREYNRNWYARNLETIREREKLRMRSRRSAGKVKPISPEKRKKHLHKYNHSEKRREVHRRWYQNNKEEIKIRTRNARIIKKHGMTANEYDEMMHYAICACCGTTETLVLDHIHDETQRSRGVLCDRCNKVLGLVKDDPILLRDLAVYLQLPILGGRT